ncbi:endonuclease III [Candidatus Woesearchaeota archaeon]|nr:endonuclease III [Candidatus Woesearchaeota archaeon]MBW3005243.1 endonuclease III [Candidatus Woesearchaeota archaeon]
MVKKEEVVKVLKILHKYHKGLSMLGTMSKSRNSYKMLISTILSARARDVVTLPVSKELFKKYPNVKSLANAKQRDVEKIIKRIGFYKNKAKNIIGAARAVQNKYKGKVPRDEKELRKLPGVGQKVAACMLVYAFGKPAIPVDTHVFRVSNRLGWVKTKTPEKTQGALEKLVPKRYWMIVNEVLVLHGQTICLPRPKCTKCPVNKYCKKVGVKK